MIAWGQHINSFTFTKLHHKTKTWKTPTLCTVSSLCYLYHFKLLKHNLQFNIILHFCWAVISLLWATMSDLLVGSMYDMMWVGMTEVRWQETVCVHPVPGPRDGHNGNNNNVTSGWCDKKCCQMISCPSTISHRLIQGGDKKNRSTKWARKNRKLIKTFLFGFGQFMYIICLNFQLLGINVDTGIAMHCSN